MVDYYIEKMKWWYLGGEQDLYVYHELVSPPPYLIVFGAGPDAIPLSRWQKI
jgi:xanthine dehydrogenase accessory factor